MSSGLFTEFERQNRPLSAHLHGLPAVRQLEEQVRHASSASALEEFLDPQIVKDRVAAIRVDGPHLGQLQRARIDERGGEPRWLSESTRVSTDRYYAKAVVSGGHEFCEFWPDSADGVLGTVDAVLIREIGGLDRLSEADDDVVRRYWNARSTWQLGQVEERGDWALYTFVDLTQEEIAESVESGLLERELRDRYEVVAPIVEAIASQVERYFNVALPEALRASAKARLRQFGDRDRAWGGILPSEPRVEPDTEPVPGVEGPTIGEPGPGAVTDETPQLDLVLAQRLSRKSFEDVQQLIRVWADAVERNPIGFSHLREDYLSDLLVATLNATTPGAQREVFSRNGRTDIHISADVLSEGPAPAVTFIGESKWVEGRRDVEEALSTQVFRYLPAHSTQAILVAFRRTQEFGADTVLDWCRGVDGFTAEGAGAVQGWPILTYHVAGRDIDVCLAAIHVPEGTTREGGPK